MSTYISLENWLVACCELQRVYQLFIEFTKCTLFLSQHWRSYFIKWNDFFEIVPYAHFNVFNTSIHWMVWTKIEYFFDLFFHRYATCAFLFLLVFWSSVYSYFKYIIKTLEKYICKHTHTKCIWCSIQVIKSYRVSFIHFWYMKKKKYCKYRKQLHFRTNQIGSTLCSRLNHKPKISKKQQQQQLKQINIICINKNKIIFFSSALVCVNFVVVRWSSCYFIFLMVHPKNEKKIIFSFFLFLLLLFSINIEVKKISKNIE